VTLRLYEGFDWANTRKAIQERAKAVRRRLQKIRQLLASGQTPDASAEDASVVMFGSVQLGLPAGASDLPPKDLLAAIDQELEDSPETDGQSTTAASRQAASEDATQRGRRSASTNAKTGKRRRRLTRPASCAIEINLRGINALFESFDAVTQLTGQTSHDPHQPPLLSRLNLDAAHLEILDNLQSSTWHKFLTELRPSDGGVVRPTGTSMLRVEMSTVRGEADASATQGEILLKVSWFDSAPNWFTTLRLLVDNRPRLYLFVSTSIRTPSTSSKRLEHSKRRSKLPQPQSRLHMRTRRSTVRFLPCLRRVSSLLKKNVDCRRTSRNHVCQAEGRLQAQARRLQRAPIGQDGRAHELLPL
jgi:hypothetical protein